MSARNRQWALAAAGALVLALALLLLGWNERVAADWHQGMARHGGGVLDLGADARPGAGQDGRLVLVTGTPEVVEAPRDDDFHVRANTPMLIREVRMLQWREVRVGGQVSYHQDWVDHPVDSSTFDQPRGHANPLPFPFAGKRFQAPAVRLDNYMLAPTIVRALPGPPQAWQADLSQLPPNLLASFSIEDGTLRTGTNPDASRLGDLRVSWKTVPLQPVTVVARVDGNRLVPDTGSDLDQGFEVQLGRRSLTDVFPDLPPAPGSVWLWRVVALLLAWAGALLLLRAWRPRPDVPAVLALGVAPLALVAGLAWLTANVAIAAVMLAVLLLAAALAWQRLGRVPR